MRVERESTLNNQRRPEAQLNRAAVILLLVPAEAANAGCSQADLEHRVCPVLVVRADHDGQHGEPPPHEIAPHERRTTQ